MTDLARFGLALVGVAVAVIIGGAVLGLIGAPSRRPTEPEIPAFVDMKQEQAVHRHALAARHLRR